MLKQDEKSNAQSWELEVTCKNKDWLDKVVQAILTFGIIDFEVELVDVISNHEEFDGRYIVLMYGNWFHILSEITSELEKIEKELDELVD